jgi:hypothetical protein
MNTNMHKSARILRHAAMVAAAAGTLLIGGLAYADDAVTMAPPVQADNSQATTADAPDNASQDSVFDWQDVPTNQDVTITRAVFDQSGYQLYDSVGETIVVPFTDDNLYVMKFGMSDDGSTYFINDGTEPVLYVPQGAYLENATVPGAKWFPFPANSEPSQPVFLGVAPSWDSYVNMGWYPDMVCYGGYYSHTPYFAGNILFPTVGLYIEIGGHHYDNWDNYNSYFVSHPAPFHIGHFHQNVYTWAERSQVSGHTFGGGHPVVTGGHPVITGSHPFVANHPFGGGHVLQGTQGRPGGGSHTFGGFGGANNHGPSAGGSGTSHAFSGNNGHTQAGTRGNSHARNSHDTRGGHDSGNNNGGGSDHH